MIDEWGYQRSANELTTPGAGWVCGFSVEKVIKGVHNIRSRISFWHSKKYWENREEPRVAHGRLENVY